MAAKYRDKFTEGDQSTESRNAFWNAGFQVCIKCDEKEIGKEKVTCGARPNGDMYGTEIFKCKNKACGWTTSFFYDDECKYVQVINQLSEISHNSLVIFSSLNFSWSGHYTVLPSMVEQMNDNKCFGLSNFYLNFPTNYFQDIKSLLYYY
jgi:hypothetical protein